LRKKYAGTLKSFGVGYKDNIQYYLGLDNKGLMYGFNKKGNVEFNVLESERLYKLWWEVVKNNFDYYEMLEKGLDFKELIENNIEFKIHIQNTINFLADEGLI
jgi:hypothetical protein